jgi:hypothetical protein
MPWEQTAPITGLKLARKKERPEEKTCRMLECIQKKSTFVSALETHVFRMPLLRQSGMAEKTVW